MDINKAKGIRGIIFGTAIMLMLMLVAGAGLLGWTETSTDSPLGASSKVADKTTAHSGTSKTVAEKKLADAGIVEGSVAVKSTAPISEEEFEAIQREQAGIPPVNSVRRQEEHDLKNGYFRTEDLADYLSTETLVELGDTGDLKALQILGDRYFQSGDYAKQFEVWEKAAVHGATSFLAGIGGYHIAGADNSELEAGEARNKVIEGLAWYQVGLKRGDGYYKAFLNNAVKRNNIQLDDDTERQVMKRAQEIYDELENERRKLGLGEFDNSVPPELEEYYQWHSERASL